MDFSNYKFRSHMVGSIIDVPKPLTKSQHDMLQDYRLRVSGEGRALTENQKKVWHSLEHKENESKEYKLSDSTKKILSRIVFNEKHGRQTILKNKYFDKGLEKEKESRDLISEVLCRYLVKDDERKSNDFVTGKRDIKDSKVIIDIKTSWSYESFSAHLESRTNEIYLRQLDSYMDLWGIEDSLLIHTLVDTPFHLIEKELRFIDFDANILSSGGNIREEFIEEVVAVVSNHIFTRQALEDFCHQSALLKIEWFDSFNEVPKKERIHMIAHSLDKQRIEQRNECIIMAREYMNKVKPTNNIIDNLKN